MIFQNLLVPLSNTATNVNPHLLWDIMHGYHCIIKTIIIIIIIIVYGITNFFLFVLWTSKSNVAVRQVACQNNSNCYPDGITSPISYISCVQGKCICSGSCFTLNGPICGFSKCGSYDSNTGICTSFAKSQTVAFLLSLFVSSVGAANFYIGQNGLGMWKIRSPSLHECTQ